jgi:hypothetical protein
MEELDDGRLLGDVLGKHGGGPRDEKGRFLQGRKPTLDRGRDYDLRRLRRDRSDLAARVEAGGRASERQPRTHARLRQYAEQPRPDFSRPRLPVPQSRPPGRRANLLVRRGMPRYGRSNRPAPPARGGYHRGVS